MITIDLGCAYGFFIAVKTVIVLAQERGCKRDSYRTPVALAKWGTIC